MKKLIALTLVAAMLMATLSGCVVSDSGTPLTTDKPTNSTAPGEPSTEPPQTEPQQSAAEELAETVIYEGEDYKITATGIDPDGMFGAEVKIMLENNTGKNVALSGSNFVVNGISITGSLYIDAAAGKKAVGELTIPSEALEIAGIDHIATVSAKDAHITDTDEYEDLADMPFDLKTSIADTYKQEINTNGDTIWESDGVTVIAQVVADSFWGNRVQLLIKNDSAKNILVQADNISVNGFMVTEIMSDAVYAGTACFGDLTIFDSDLEDSGITDIENVAFSLKILNPDTYDTIAESGELTVYTAG